MYTGNTMCDAIQKLSNTYFKDLINKVEYFEGKSDCPELYLAFIYKETSLKRNLRGGLNVSYKLNENNFLFSFDSNTFYEVMTKFFSKKLKVLLVVENPITGDVEIIQ